MEDHNRKWLVFIDQPPDQPQNEFRVENVKLINLDAVRLVDQVTPTLVRLVFSEQSVVEINGGAAGELVMTLMSRGMTPGGIPYPLVQIPEEEPASEN